MRTSALIAAAALTFFVGWKWGLPPTADIRNAVNVIAGASATILGFLVSSGALLYAVMNTRLVRNLQRTKHFEKLLGSLFFDGLCFLVALIVGLLCLFLSDKAMLSEAQGVSWLTAGIYTMIFANAVAYILLVPLGHDMWILLSNIKPDDPETLE